MDDGRKWMNLLKLLECIVNMIQKIIRTLLDNYSRFEELFKIISKKLEELYFQLFPKKIILCLSRYPENFAIHKIK